MTFIDILNLYAIQKGSDDLQVFFEDIEMPSGIDKYDVYMQILLECGQLKPLFYTTDTMHEFSKHFFHIHRETFEKLLDTLHYDYNPIHNYDRTQTDTRQVTQTSNAQTVGSAQTESENIDKISGIDSNTLVVKGSNVGSANDSSSVSNTGSGTTTETYTTRMMGNIGVTTTQQMIEAERKLHAFNIIKTMVSMYAKNLFVQMY